MNALSIAIMTGAAGVLASCLLSAVNRVQARKQMERVLKSPKKPDPRALENPKYGSVVTQVNGFKVKTEKGEIVELPWNDIEEIYAFKRDLFMIDLICLAFKLDTGKYYEIHEEMAGYHDFLDRLQKQLPEFNLDWFGSVAFPALKTNYRCIWKRPANECSNLSSRS